MVITVDNEVKFDVPYSYLKLKPGEKVIDKLDQVEDTKGNGGDIGRMFITNLRIIWHLLSSAYINLTIGYNCIISMKTLVVNSMIKGKTEALHIISLYHNSKFEFIFTDTIATSQKHFTALHNVYKEYSQTKLYRELRLRSAIIQHGQLKILPFEQIYSNIAGVWNLSSDQGNLGTLIITNIRIVWYADVNSYFNITLPYLQIETISVKESKFGMTLIIVSNEISGAYVLGFRMSTLERLYEIYKEITTLYNVALANPIYGIDCKKQVIKNQVKKDNEEKVDLIDETTEYFDSKSEISNAFTIYMTDEMKKPDNNFKSHFYVDFGLSIEPLTEGYTPKKLWQIISN